MTGWTLGIIGGSGLYALDGLEDRATLRVEGPFGSPSDDLVTGRIGTTRLVFLPRHGVGHRIPPGDINARANIDALKRAGCTDVLSLSAVGSLREDLPPGTFIAVDQYIDRTVSRASSFFGPASGLARRAGRPRRGRHGGGGGNLPGHGGPAVLQPRRKRALQILGLRRDRHDQHAGGQAGP
jgi:purine nucleoside phosphorylase